MAAAAAAPAAVTCASLLESVADTWHGDVTNHKFIQACVDGSVAPAQFNTWLVQDYLFVRGFVGFSGATLAAAPDSHVDTLLSGLGAQHAELEWFKVKAQERGLQLGNTGMQPTCQAYRGLLAELKTAPYATQAAAMWAIELAYHTAWARVLRHGTAEQYREFGDRWGNAGFAQFVSRLEAQADEALAQSPEQAGAAREIVGRIAALEVEFWAMAYDTTATGGGSA